jgi:hypothetical protein
MPRPAKPASDRSSGLSIRLTLEQNATLDRLAEEERRSRNSMASALVDRFLAAYDAQRSTTPPLVTPDGVERKRYRLTIGEDLVAAIDALFGLGNGVRESIVIAAIAAGAGQGPTKPTKKPKGPTRS